MQALRSSSDLAVFVRTTRQKKRWTQAELGARAGLAEKHVNRIENGASEPRISSVIALLAALGHDLRAQEISPGSSGPQSVEDIF
ncbi:helix-turn-helix transcriptional regulator [Shimia sp. R11_0]|uniref:helix-turn-helix domain-containing protein n=1 Tax=Shimia sp. R11_0 TaxID=2821096 RepID=UPI001ADC6B48|nr:helix-turn-helix transcriptional regulator [Shimia sp. R11_0]MBO9479699.1 helix-turn-helix transcriptional regulator [Shimia sp. R11_0]